MNELKTWYQITNSEQLEQGDIILNVPVAELPSDFSIPSGDNGIQESEVVVHYITGIVMSQSCDLAHPGKLEFVTFCPVYLLDEIAEFSSTSKRESLRQGRMVAYHLLNKCQVPNHERGFMVVEFKRVFCVPIALTRYLAKEQGDRLRLKSPYKEHLAQSFARYYMRVGLPVDIPPFK